MMRSVGRRSDRIERKVEAAIGATLLAAYAVDVTADYVRCGRATLVSSRYRQRATDTCDRLFDTSKRSIPPCEPSGHEVRVHQLRSLQ